MSYKDDLTKEDIESKILYNRETGEFFRLPNMSKVWFNEGGSTLIKLKINKKTYRIPAHNLAWFLCYGCYPEETVMHKNMDKFDFRIDNLKQVSNRHLIRVNNIFKCLKQGIRLKPHDTDKYKYIVNYNDGKPRRNIIGDVVIAYAFLDYITVVLKRDLEKLGVDTKVLETL